VAAYTNWDNLSSCPRSVVGTHGFNLNKIKGVDGQDEPGHDEVDRSTIRILQVGIKAKSDEMESASVIRLSARKPGPRAADAAV
jgi:hypothetical protein